MSRNIRRLKHSEEFSNYYMSVDESEDLKQHGILGQKWGQRLYQNKDGSLTPLGRVHYGVGSKRAKQMHEKGYTLGDYEGYKSYKKIQKRSSFKDKNWKLKKEAANTYNEDIITDSAKRNASRDYYIDMHRRKPMIMALASKDDKQKISELAEKYANSEEYRRAKEFLDKHKDEFINKPEEKKIDIQDKEYSFEEESKKYGLKSDQYYEDLYNNALKDPDMKKKFDKWSDYGDTKEKIIESEKLYDETFKEIAKKLNIPEGTASSYYYLMG